MKLPSGGVLANSGEGEKKVINSELWHACAGPLVSLPPVGSLAVYFPQGHSEQVAASMGKEADSIPSYSNLPSKLFCLLRNVTLHADVETDEVYAQMTLQPVSKYDQEALLASDIGLKHSRQPAEFFCKTLTASDTSTHGGFSVPRRAAEKIFPPLDFSMQPPAQELTARDLHDQIWTFRHIYRGQPKRHLLTTGWSVFVSSKRLTAGDAVLFIRDEKSQLLLGIRRANRQQPALSSSVISSDSMHIGILAAAAHAAANNSPFTIFYNPRASPSEFVISLAKYNKAMYAQVSLGMRFRMMFETEDSGVRRYMGTITGISDLDPIRWKNSKWRNLQVGWDESMAGERPSRVSIWEIEPIVTPFYICPPPFFRPKLPKSPGFPDDDSDIENMYKRGLPWLANNIGLKDASNSVFPGLSLVQWMSMQQNHQLPANQSGLIPNAALRGNLTVDDHSKLLNFQSSGLAASNVQLSKGNHQNQPVGQLQQSNISWPQQPHPPQMSWSPTNTQQQQQWQPLPLQHPQSQLSQQLQLHQPKLLPQQPHQHQHQQSILLPPAATDILSDKVTNQNSQQTAAYSQLQQQQIPTENGQLQQNDLSANQTTFPIVSINPDLPFQQHIEQPSSLLKRPEERQVQVQQPPLQVLQQSLVQRPQVQPMMQQGLSEPQLQLPLLQKLHQLPQQQHQQHSSPLNPLLDSQLPQEQQAQQNQQTQHLPLPAQQSNGSFSSAPTHGHSPQFPVNQFHCQQKSPLISRASSGRPDGDALSCSTPSSKNNLQVSQPNLLENQTGSAALLDNNTIVHPSTLMRESQRQLDVHVKQELPNSKASEMPKYKNTATDLMEATSSATSCLDAGGLIQNFPPTSFNGDVQSHTRNNLPFATSIHGLAPDTLLSRDSDSVKDIQNLLSNCSGTPRDFETDLSSGINSQSYGVPAMSFKPGCSTAAVINDTAAMNGGLWPNQAQYMRTYTKVQKRGSVGRTIDVTHYKGYDELRRDLAQMFGIEGLLEDPLRTEWKLVYVDHENDILLVGDDPWEEFVSCVQGIKILSSAEVQQMSLDGDLSPQPTPNQACSGTHSGNPWRGHYDDNSAASFNR